MARPTTSICPFCKRWRLTVDPETGKLEEHQLSVDVQSIPDGRLAAVVTMRCPGSDAVCGEWMETRRW